MVRRASVAALFGLLPPLLAPVLPPGAVVLSESEPIAYYLDNVVSGASPFLPVAAAQL